MITCEKCGHENNDGSRVCLNCRESLMECEVTCSESCEYIQAKQEADKDVAKAVHKTQKTAIIFFAVLFASIGLIALVRVMILCAPVVDDQLLGSWKLNDLYIMTFKDDGTCITRRSGSLEADAEQYYRAEDGVLKLSFSRDVEHYTVMEYTYLVGYVGDKECLILEYYSSGVQNRQVLYRHR